MHKTVKFPSKSAPGLYFPWDYSDCTKKASEPSFLTSGHRLFHNQNLCHVKAHKIPALPLRHAPHAHILKMTVPLWHIFPVRRHAQLPSAVPMLRFHKESAPAQSLLFVLSPCANPYIQYPDTFRPMPCIP